MLDQLLFEANDFSRVSSHTQNFIEEEYVNLPSRGYFFTSKHYKNIDKVKLKKLSYREEDILTTNSYYDNDSLVEEILRSVIVDKNFPVHEITEIDKDMIFIWLRIGAFGQYYGLSTLCSNCKKSLNLTWDLGGFEMPDYPESYIKELKEFGYIKIVNENKEFSLTSPTMEDKKRVKEFLREINKDEDKSLVTQQLLLTIKSIKDKEEVIEGVKQVYEWLTKNRLSIQSSRSIQKYGREITLQRDTNLEVICSECFQEHTYTILPITKDFFNLRSKDYREFLLNSVNFLVFWGKIDYQSALSLPTYLRRYWIKRTQDNLEILYGKK